MYLSGADIMSACTGSFLLAEAGLLDGRTATTHWAFQALFTERYPSVRLAPQAILVDQGRIVTAGGATSFINLTLFLVERLLGQDVAWAASRMFLVDPNKSPQGAYAALSTQKGHDDKPILAAQEIIEREVGRLPQVDELARRVSLSRRTFVRRFHSATGNSPRAYTQRVRVEAAKRALERGDSVSEVATRVGYDDAVAFRKLFVRLSGLTPAEYRSRYGPRAAPAWELTTGKRSRRPQLGSRPRR
jgi:transcriptional regulator GlxA family with amidase domain